VLYVGAGAKPSRHKRVWRMGRRVAILPAVMPIPGSTVDHMETSMVTSESRMSACIESHRFDLHRKSGPLVRFLTYFILTIVAVLPLGQCEPEEFGRRRSYHVHCCKRENTSHEHLR
jgi:hypothetical protein